MKEFSFLCTVCDASFPGPAELHAHLAERHQPSQREDLVELAKRGGDVEAEPLETQIWIGAIPVPECVVRTGLPDRLTLLQLAAARAIRNRDMAWLRKLRVELEDLQVAAAKERDRQARIAAITFDSLGMIERVLELPPEAPE